MSIQISKQNALLAYGSNASALARDLGITPQAVYQWSDAEPIPEVHALKLRFVLRPDIFGEAPPSETASEQPADETKYRSTVTSTDSSTRAGSPSSSTACLPLVSTGGMESSYV